MHDAVLCQCNDNTLRPGALLFITDGSDIFHIGHAVRTADEFQARNPGRIGQDLSQVIIQEAIRIGHDIRNIFLVYHPEFRDEFIHDLLDGLQHPAAEFILRRRTAESGISVAPGKEHIRYDIADIIAHRTIKSKLRIKNKSMILINEDRTRMQVTMN